MTVKNSGLVAQGFRIQNQQGLCRRGRLQKTRPLALTNAAITRLIPTQTKEKNRCWNPRGAAKGKNRIYNHNLTVVEREKIERNEVTRETCCMRS